MTTQPWIPTEDYSGLTLERIQIIGDVIRTARAAAYLDHHPERGETNWSLGCRCYECTCFALAEAAKEHSWIEILAGGYGASHFVMRAGGHPIRFCSGDPETMPGKYLQQSFAELGLMPANRILRITIASGIAGPADIYLVEVDEETGNTTKSYLIPEVNHATNIVEFIPPAPPVQIPPVVAESVEAETATDSETGTKSK
jgi:hypothetical protein